MIRSPLITVMTDAVLKAARGLQRDFGEIEQLQVSRKGPGDFVTAADRKAEAVIRDMLRRARPSFGLVMEESGEEEGSDGEHRFHVDPLDGTMNFLHGLPHFAISVGLERAGQFVAGVVYDPLRDEMFVAERGAGAFLNNKRARVAARSSMADALVALDAIHPARAGTAASAAFLKDFATLGARAAGVKRMGSAALDLAYVAAGRLDACAIRGLKSWDLAAGAVLVREAGGAASPLGGEADGPLLDAAGIVAGNETLHRELRELLARA